MSNMEQAAQAFGYLAALLKLNGRRLERAYLESRMRLRVYDPLDLSTRAPMGPRKHRREVARTYKIPFRPVYFYRGPAK